MCPACCLTERSLGYGRGPLNLRCRCPDVRGKASPCSWVGYNGEAYNFPVCLDAIPTDFYKDTLAIFIKHLRSSTVMARSFPDSPQLQNLHIRESNVSMIQPGAFEGLQLVENLYLTDNLIFCLEPDTFLGLLSLRNLYINKNKISFVSQHAFRGLPTLADLSLAENQLRSVPVDALLWPKSLRFATLTRNHITTVDHRIMWLKRNQSFHLMMNENRLTCSKNLTCGTLLTSFQKVLIEFGGCDQSDTSVTTATLTHTGSTVATTTSKATNTLSIILTGEPITTSQDDKNLIALITAVAVPLATVLTFTAIFVIKNNYCGLARQNVHVPGRVDKGDSSEVQDSTANPTASRQPSSDQATGNDCTIQPYAVTYADVTGDGENSGEPQFYAMTSLQHPGPSTVTHDEDPGPQLRPYSVTRDENHLEPGLPYSVTHDEDPGPQLQPYSVTHDEDPGPQLQPYAVTNDEDPGPQL
ncbi:hypothetical protein Bbelb_215500 [Branchiostoma belcheri]|nr:hypothetical protein Bbelb_215500 [Branchiostoma belcheri]